LKTVYLALGSNLGDREAHLSTALERLDAADVRIARRSSVYETEPRDFLDQPWFLNMVVESQTELFPMQLLSRIQAIELELGRQRRTPKGPRTIDIDILLYGNAVIHTSKLEVPHPRMVQRRFVLEPLAEIAPDLRLPVDGRTIREILSGTLDQQLRKTDTRV
jgi:2-amino-4-hydroxy-6-hydroxymethyldihydropteridine diphosphokinase